MNSLLHTRIAFPIALAAALGASFSVPSRAQAGPEIGGEKLVTLTRPITSQAHPEFTSVTLAPGRGMS